MKPLLLIFLLSFNFSWARDLGEDESNVDCVKSVQDSRPYLATLKLDRDEEDMIKEVEEDLKTISK